MNVCACVGVCKCVRVSTPTSVRLPRNAESHTRPSWVSGAHSDDAIAHKEHGSALCVLGVALLGVGVAGVPIVLCRLGHRVECRVRTDRLVHLGPSAQSHKVHNAPRLHADSEPGFIGPLRCACGITRAAHGLGAWQRSGRCSRVVADRTQPSLTGRGKALWYSNYTSEPEFAHHYGAR